MNDGSGGFKEEEEGEEEEEEEERREWVEGCLDVVLSTFVTLMSDGDNALWDIRDAFSLRRHGHRGEGGRGGVMGEGNLAAAAAAAAAEVREEWKGVSLPAVASFVALLRQRCVACFVGIVKTRVGYEVQKIVKGDDEFDEMEDTSYEDEQLLMASSLAR